MSAARRSGVALVVVAVVVAAAAFGLRQLWNSAQNHLQSNGCDVTTYSVDNNQAAVAATMVSVVITRNLPERAAVLTLAAALQESNLRNLAGGDSDSVGVLQQRPSQGWGTPAQLNDLHYATGKFLDALVKIPSWQTEPLAEVIQAVQISADGTLYAQHEPLAQGLSDALTGVTPAGLNCKFAKPTGSDTATAVSAALIADLPVKSPTVTGNTITVPQASWTTATWFVAQANDLGITSVSYAGQKWQPKKGWKTDKSASSAHVVAVVGTKS